MKEIIVPAAGESVTEADIVSWYKEDGDYVEVDDVLLELETDKASLEMAAEQAGVLKIAVSEGTVEVGQVLGTIDPSAAPAATSSPAVPVQESTPEPIKQDSQTTQATSHYAQGHPSPAAEKMIQERGVDKTAIAATGKDGRITKQDVQASLASSPQVVEAPQESHSVSSSSPAIAAQPVRREKMSRLRKTIAKRLVQAKLDQAQLSTFNEVDLTNIMNLRKQYKEAFKEKNGVGLGFMSFFTKAVCLALKEYPVLNAQVDGDHIVYNDDCHIGIAVAAPRGLVVPVIKQAQHLNFEQIEGAIVNFAKKAKDGSLAIDEMEGGTFTITNGGTFGSMLSTPIVNFPQSAILGMHNIIQRPMAINGEIKIRPMMYVAVSYDHRIIDGSDAVRFLVAIKERLEDPARLLIEI